MTAPILVLTPDGRDAEVIGLVLGEVGLTTRACADLRGVCEALKEDVVALLLSESALLSGADDLISCLEAQPPWSDLPVLVLTTRGARPAGEERREFFQRLGNVTLLDRPLHAEALQSAARAALRARTRQYRSRAHLKEIEQASALLELRVAERTRELQSEMAERRRAEETLHQAQKMEVMGQLTGGVAHDFNNVLQGIASCLAVLDRYVPDGTPRTLFEAASQSIDRGAHLTQSLLAFARRQTLMPRPTDLREMLEGMRPLLERSLGGMIHVAIDVSAGTAAALVDRAQLESAILNLAINARDAMPTGGLLTLRAANAVVPSDGESGQTPDLAPGDYVMVIVEDTGIGMDAATLTRVFEPFFTTKPVDKGSGLGLSMVYGMASQSGGGVHIASSVGVGTAITLYLPSAPLVEMRAEQLPEKIGGGNGETILLVEDNAIVRMGMVALLEDLGYRVIEVDSGEAALEVLRDGDTVGALVTDFAMPSMNGGVLVREARRLFPELPVMVVSGYAEMPDFGEPVRLLHKPVSADELAAGLSAILHG